MDKNSARVSAKEEIERMNKMQDEKCPFYKWLADDAIHLSTGDGKCMARGPYPVDEHGGSFDYYACDSGNHQKCPYFLEAQNRQGRRDLKPTT